ncbi:hypothetical protein ASPWEDRAFT_170511 [Aspergillus wentii DTO 134E9]|uniref:LysM domain-containing protein n=1 Tax=Aspergillus wentii DTO 134E9 TaxID=1073089 RepID=A0A1L9RQ14_ASPWE|nr:uncharacterized protein ASPWEDRAFT_170511 [Aspergillus wentii DTO 134E9]OJJ37014.1 hypothetical protein ASPWEDRAFT_170511 [Aspergillus wentii DTO 134E9]
MFFYTQCVVLTLAVTLPGVLGQNATTEGLQLFPHGPFPSLSASCATAFTANLSCSLLETGNSMYQFNTNLSTKFLDTMCTDSCRKSITEYRKNVIKACSNDTITFGNNGASSRKKSRSSTVYRPIALADYYFTNLEQRCTKDGNGNYCYKMIESESIESACDECLLKMPQIKLSNPYFYKKGLASRYASRTSSCSVSTLPIRTGSPVVLTSASASSSATPKCTAPTVPIHPGDTCDSIAAAQNISTWQLLSDNGLPGGCTDFPSNGTLCITGTCQTHLMTKNDTCQGIAKQYGITITQFRTWNPSLNGRCTNLDIVKGHYVCVSNPGHFTRPRKIGSSNKSATSAVPVPTNVAPGTNTRCGKYYDVQEGESCARIAMANSISFDEILFLNPDLNSDCTNLRPGSQYCILPVGDIETYSGYEATASGKPSSSTATVTRPAITGTRTPWDQLPEATGKRTDYPKQTEAPLAKGTRKDCEEYMENIYGKDVDCSYFRIQVPMSYFVTWNPSLFYWNCTLANATRYCTKLGEGFTIDTSEDDAVYASVPKNAALNSTHRCFSWHNVTRGDGCDSIREEADIGMGAFYGWNPSIRRNCTGLQLGVSYCVSGEGYDDTSFSTPTPTPSSTRPSSSATPKSTCPPGGVTPPGPTQSGIPCNCNKYAKHEDGKYCQDIADENDCTLEQFYKWNPALGGNCKALWPDYSYCVGVSK